MTETTWRYLEMIWDEDHHGGDTSQALAVINDLWPDLEAAAQELAEAYLEVEFADANESARDALVRESERYRIGALACHLSAMQGVLLAGLEAIGAPAIEFIARRFKESGDAALQTVIALLLARLGSAAAACVPLLLAEVANSATPEKRFRLRQAAAYALGKLDVASPEVVETLAQLAGADSEAQALRSFCIEALMDLGPAAAAAIPVLERVLKNEAEDEDLRNFAWSALKSVGAPSREHPCGGTVAEHMRSLYRAE
jgi:hypothetical protein